jgi:hypothetical protein
MSHSVAGHTFDPVVHTNSYQCRDCSLVITDYALFGSVTLPPPCPGPKAQCPPPTHAWASMNPAPKDTCRWCHLTVVDARLSGQPCSAAPAPRMSTVVASACTCALTPGASCYLCQPFFGPPAGQQMFTDDEPSAEALQEFFGSPRSGPPRCPACDIELCPVIDEFAGVLGPFCARCRR